MSTTVGTPTVHNGHAFGFMPADVVHTLLDIGNWRKRAAAMDAFHSLLQQHIASAGVAAEHFAELAAFVYRLVKDPNFKICVSAMSELMAVISAAPELSRPQAPAIAPLLVDRLCDSKQLLRQQAHAVLQTMTAKLGPDATLAALASCCGHYAPRAREEIANAFIAALLSYPAFPFQWSAVTKALLTLMDDPKGRVRLAALEGMCLVADRLPASRLANIFTALQCPGDEPERVALRAQSPARPRLTDGGLVEHCVDLDGCSSHTGSNTGLWRVPSGSFAGLPFEVPSPGQFPRAGSASSSRAGQGNLDKPQCGSTMGMARPKRSNHVLPSQLPLSYFHRPTVFEAPSSTHASVAAKLAAQVSKSRRDAPTPQGTPLEGPRRMDAPATDLTSATEEDQPSAPLVKDELQGSLYTIDSKCSASSARIAARHTFKGSSLTGSARDSDERGSDMPMQLSTRVSGCTLSATKALADMRASLARSDSELQPMLFDRREPPASPLSLTALSPTARQVSLGRQVLRSASNTQSAPASDTQLRSSLSAGCEVHSPSKIVRLESLKRRQAERRAQSAGLLVCPTTLLAPRQLSVGGILGDTAPAGAQLQPRSPSGTSSDHTLYVPLSSPSRSVGRAPRQVVASHGRPKGSDTPYASSRAPSLAFPESTTRDQTYAASAQQADGNTHAPLPEVGTSPSEFDVRGTTASTNPEQDLALSLADLARANESKRKELDWVAQQDAVNSMRRLLHHHEHTVAEGMKDVLAAMLPCTAALRSSTAKAALQFFQELFQRLGARLGSELDEIAPCLLRKAGEMSTAGRDNFLAQYADAALSQMILSCPEQNCAKCLMAMMKVSSQPIRLKVAGHVDELLGKSRGAVCRSGSMQSQLFSTAAALLEAGSAEARTHAKRLIFALKRFLSASAMTTLLQQCKNQVQERRVAATLELLGPPEAPPRLAQSFAAVLGWDAAAAYARQVRAQLPLQVRAPGATSGQLLDDSDRSNNVNHCETEGTSNGSAGRPQRSASVHSSFRAAASSRSRLHSKQQDTRIRGGSMARATSRTLTSTLRAQNSLGRVGHSVGPRRVGRTDSHGWSTAMLGSGNPVR